MAFEFNFLGGKAELLEPTDSSLTWRRAPNFDSVGQSCVLPWRISFFAETRTGGGVWAPYQVVITFPSSEEPGLPSHTLQALAKLWKDETRPHGGTTARRLFALARTRTVSGRLRDFRHLVAARPGDTMPWLRLITSQNDSTTRQPDFTTRDVPSRGDLLWPPAEHLQGSCCDLRGALMHRRGARCGA